MSTLLLWLLLLFGVDLFGPISTPDATTAANTGTTFTVLDDGTAPPPIARN